MSVQGITATVMATDLTHALCSDGWRNPGDGSKFGEHVSALLKEWAAQSITPIAADPAPVVPEVRTVDPAGVVESADEAYVSGWNDCREAMLANTYATNPQEAVALGVLSSRPTKVLMEHSGCGQGTQVDSITVRLNPGDKVVLEMGKYSAAMLEKEQAK